MANPSSPAKKHVVIIGGGFSGLAAAYHLLGSGAKITILEEQPDLGGLAGCFEVSPGVTLEKFYHHWFTSDTDILGLVNELGLDSALQYNKTNTGLYHANSVFRLASPIDLLKFTALPFFDRIRTGFMALTARRIRDWHSLEDLSAEEWIISLAGRRSYEVIWQPLLKGKFGVEAENVSAVWFWNKLKLRGSSRGKGGSESLVYLHGGFSALLKALRKRLEDAGVEIRTSTAVNEITINNGRADGVITSTGRLEADAVLATVPLPVFIKLAPGLPQAFKAAAAGIRFLGNICLIFRLRQSLSSTYWLNVADPSFPFVGVIEHTNMDSRSNYGGEHIAYVSKYLPTSDPLFALEKEALLDYSLPYLQRIFPEFSRDWIIDCALWRASYSQPVITRNYSEHVPPFQTPAGNLWLCTMAQIYPEDRGTNYAVKYGRLVAEEMKNAHFGSLA